MKSSLILALTLSGLLNAAEPFLEKQDLFTVGDDPAFKIYHIPGIVVTAKGSVLAWCEARRDGSDWDDIKILLRRSTDEGQTWNVPRSIVAVPGPKRKNALALELNHTDPDTVTYNNPVLIADRDGTVHMLFCLEYERAFYQRSEDDGLTWSRPVEITATFDKFKNVYPWKVLATGPNHGIQLRTGRLVVPVWLSTGTGGNAHRPSVTATIVSDDNGQTWHAGEIAVPNTEVWINPNETAVVELTDGTVMLNVRSESTAHRRLIVTGPDGATRWSSPRFDDALLEPICMGGLVRYDHGGESALLFTNPHNLEGGREADPRPGQSRARKNLSVKLSRDGGQTWPLDKLLEDGPSAYSDIAVTNSGMILCFYGAGTKPGFAGSALRLARFNREWLAQP